MPEVAAVIVERALLGLAAFGDHRRDAARGGEQRGGLGADDLEVALLAGLDPALRVSWSTSPCAIVALAELRILSTLRLPSSTISSNARLNRKSPTSTVAGLPKTMLAVSLPRRVSLPSTTSSCSSVAVWMNSTAAASLWWRAPW
jgi:hypothetical protein